MLSKKTIHTIGTLFIGSIFGFYTSSFEFFKFNPEINLVDFSSLIITSLLGLFIAVSVQKNITNEKSEKDLLISEINQIKIEFKKIYTNVINDNLNFDDTVSSFKQTSSNLSSLEDLFKIVQIEDNQKIKKISKMLIVLKKLVTNSPVSDSLLRMSIEDKNVFLTKYRVFTSLFFELIVEVNRK